MKINKIVFFFKEEWGKNNLFVIKYIYNRLFFSSSFRETAPAFAFYYLLSRSTSVISFDEFCTHVKFWKVTWRFAFIVYTNYCDCSRLRQPRFFFFVLFSGSFWAGRNISSSILSFDFFLYLNFFFLLFLVTLRRRWMRSWVREQVTR